MIVLPNVRLRAMLGEDGADDWYLEGEDVRPYLRAIMAAQIASGWIGRENKELAADAYAMLALRVADSILARIAGDE